MDTTSVKTLGYKETAWDVETWEAKREREHLMLDSFPGGVNLAFVAMPGQRSGHKGM